MAVTGADLLHAYLVVLAVLSVLLLLLYLYWRFVFKTGKPVFFLRRSKTAQRFLLRTRLFPSGAEVESDCDEDSDNCFAPLDATNV